MGVPLAMKEDTHGNVWIVTEYGLAVCNGEGDIQTTLRVDVHDISSMAIDGWGNLWLGTRGHGLYRVVPAYRDGKVVECAVRHFAARDGGLLSNNVEALCADVKHRKVWIGTMEGNVQAWDAQTNAFKDYSSLFYTYINETVNDIMAGQDGHIWISTAKNGWSSIRTTKW